MTYRAKPITQRDGSSLANSNCRMASIATGLDFHTLGAKTSTGKAMRAHQDDQSGGTGSDDAKQAWSEGYDESLRVMDGYSWSNVLSDLRAGRLVHLDVWHATAGGPCLSGSGAYGHTMAVAPEYDGSSKWLVADPWCSPGKWTWWPESKLKAGAEEWGRRVLYTATGGMPPWGTPAWRKRLAELAKLLMSRWDPGHPAPDPGDNPDTGGAQAVMYTTTKAQATGGSGVVGILWDPMRWADPGVDLYLDSDCTVRVTATEPGGYITTLGPKARQDENGADWNALGVLVSTGKLYVPDDGLNHRAVLWAKRSDLPDAAEPTAQEWDDSAWSLLGNPEGRYPCPEQPPPDPEPTPDPGDPGRFFSIAHKGQAFQVAPGDWVRLPFDVGAWLASGYATLTVQLYAEQWGDFEAPSDIRTRLVRLLPDGTEDYTAELVHAVADDWAMSRDVTMYVDADKPVAVDVRVMQAPITLHTMVYRGVPLLGVSV